MATTPKQMDLVPRQRPRDIMADRVREQMEKSTERMKALFATADLLQDRTLNVEVFRINFLPYFCGELAWTDEFKQAWQAVAGTFLNPVNLWDENNAVVVVVPPMVDTNVIQSVGRDLDAKGRVPLPSADAIMAQSQQRATFNPNLAQNRLAQQLAQRFNVTGDGPSPRLKEQWEKLFAYFGKSMTPKLLTDETAKKPDAEDDFDYGFD